MKLLVFPGARRQDVEAIVREALGDRGGNNPWLTVAIVRTPSETLDRPRQ